MKDLILKRNELRKNAMDMRPAKFEPGLSYEQQKKIDDEQDKIYKKYKFFDNYLKKREEVKRKN